MTNFKPKRGTYYDVLGVPPASTSAQLKAAYYALSAELHPDVATGAVEEKAERFKAVALAYGVLKNAEFRAQYDTRLKLEGWLDCARCQGTGRCSGFVSGKYVKDGLCAQCAGRGHL